MTIYSIYCFTNKINSKVYIGFASNYIKRKSAHKKAADRGCNTKFYHAIRKYGWDNFVFEVIYQSLDKEHTRDIMEPYFIKTYNSLKNGYNSTVGGEGAPTVWGKNHPMKRQEQRKRQSDFVKGKNNPIHKISNNKKKCLIENLFSQEAISKKSGMNHYTKKQNYICKTSGNNNPMRRLDVRLKRSGDNNPMKRPEIAIKITDKNIYTFENIETKETVSMTRNEFIKTYNISASNLSRVINGTRNLVSGWKVVNNKNGA